MHISALFCEHLQKKSEGSYLTFILSQVLKDNRITAYYTQLDTKGQVSRHIQGEYVYFKLIATVLCKLTECNVYSLIKENLLKLNISDELENSYYWLLLYLYVYGVN